MNPYLFFSHGLKILPCPLRLPHGDGGSELRDSPQNISKVCSKDLIIRTVKWLTGKVAGSCPRGWTDDVTAYMKNILPQFPVFRSGAENFLQLLSGHTAERATYRAAKT